MAKREIRSEIVLSGEQKYRNALKGIADDLKSVSAKQAVLNAEYGKGDQSIAKNMKQQDLLREKLAQQEKQLELIRAEHERVAAAKGEDSEQAKKLAREYDFAEAACTRTRKTLQTLEKQFATATDKTIAFQKKMRELGLTTEAAGKKMANFGGKMTTRVSAPAVAGLTVISKAFMDFEDVMANVGTIADTTQVSMDDLSESVIDASNNVGVAATEMGDATYQALSAGVGTGDAVGYVESAAKAAVAGMSDVTTVINGSTSAINAWKLDYADATSVLDKMILAQNAGKTSLGELASSIGTVTGLAPQLNMSLEEVLASTAALTKNGVATSTAMNGLQAVMSSVLKPSSEAAEYAKKIGLEFSSSALKSKGFTEFLADVMTKTKGSEDGLAKLFGSVEGLSKIMMLGGSAAGDYADILAQMGDSAGLLQKTFDTRTASRAQQMKKALNELTNQTIRAGQAMAPAVDMIGGALSGLADKLQGASDGQIEFGVKLAGAVVVAGPAITIVGKLTQGIGMLQKSIGSTSNLLGKTIGGGKLALVAGGIGAVIAGIAALKKHMDSLSGTNKLKAAFSNITVDTSAIDTAVEEAEKTEYELELLTKAKIKLSSDSTNLSAWAVDWLSDGKKETNKQRAEFETKASEAFAPIFESIQKSYDEKKAALDTALATGSITPESYKTRLEELKTDTESTKTALSAETTAYTQYVLMLSRTGTKPTEAQLAKLKELEAAIIGIGNSILEANSIAQQAAKASFSLVSSGGGDTGDVVTAVKYAKSVHEGQQSSADQIYQQTMADLQTKLDKAKKNGDTKAIVEIPLQMEAEKKSYEENTQQITDNFNSMVDEIYAGLAKKYPELSEKLQKITEDQDLFGQIEEAIKREDNYDEIQSIWKKIFPDSEFSGNLLFQKEVLAGRVEELKKEMASEIDNTDFSPLYTDLSAALQTAGKDVDMSEFPKLLTDALTSVDMESEGTTNATTFVNAEKAVYKAGIPDMRKLGGDSIDGFIKGALAKGSTLRATFKALAAGAYAAAQAELDSHSPSRKFMALGGDTADGYILGLRSKISSVQTEMRRMVEPPSGAAAFTAGQTLGVASSSGSSTTNINVNYTGGVSTRDTRRLSNQLGRYYEANRRGKGQR